MNPKGIDSRNSEGIETYPNELNNLTVADDVNGNGVFDPHGTHGNIHPDAGVFQDHMSLPGYVARDHFYELSEVMDLTKPDGRTMYVPGGAVSFQQGQLETIDKNALLWKIPPGMDQFNPGHPGDVSIVDAPTPAIPIGQTEDPAAPADNTKYYWIAAGAGVAIGVAYILMSKKKRGRR